jgi:hypothetical protein
VAFWHLHNYKTPNGSTNVPSPSPKDIFITLNANNDTTNAYYRKHYFMANFTLTRRMALPRPQGEIFFEPHLQNAK